jgi:hypothetical protein
MWMVTVLGLYLKKIDNWAILLAKLSAYMWQWDQYRNESHHESHNISMGSHAIKALIADIIKKIHAIHLKSNIFYKIARFYKFS